MLPTFLNAMLARRSVVAGVRLRPLTLAQAYCLAAWESPYFTPRAEPVTLSDFGLALWTCTQDCWPFERFADSVIQGKPDKALTRWGRRYDIARFDEDSIALSSHIAWHCAVPDRFMEQGQKSRGNSAPWPLVVALILMERLPEDRVWRLPMPLALAYKIAADNAGGDHTWKSEAETSAGVVEAKSCQPS
jgi:hypothetical protein